jgi:hypothetical protein
MGSGIKMINETIEQIKKATDYQINKKILKEKVISDLHIVHNEGLFLITIELLSYLSISTDVELILEDTYGNPIKVDRVKLLEDARQLYKSTTEMWLTEHDKLRRIRII